MSIISIHMRYTVFMMNTIRDGCDMISGATTVRQASFLGSFGLNANYLAHCKIIVLC